MTEPSPDPRNDLDPDPETMRQLGYRAVDLAVAWLQRLPDAPVARMPDPAVLAPLVAEALPTAGLGVEASMAHFCEVLMPHGTLVNHPRFFAYIPCPGSFVGALGEFLAASTNLFTGTWLGGAVAAQLEVQVVDWLREAIGLPAGFEGVLTSGGSVANLAALATARAQFDVRHGVEARHRARIYLSEGSHFSLQKAAGILGFLPQQIVTLPIDGDRRLRPETVTAAVAADRAAGALPMLVAANFGATTTGSIDPIDGLADVAAATGMWFHADGAYGAAVGLLPEWRDRTACLARADSITLDPHKWLYAPFESGCLLTRRVDLLETAFAGEGAYMQDIPKEEINLFRRGPELSRGNRAMKLWLLFRGVGVEAIAAAIRADIRHCRLARDLLAADPRFEIVVEPELSVFCFAHVDGEEASTRLMHAILADGYLMLSSSRVEGRYVLRFCVANPQTTEADIRSSVERIRELARGKKGEGPR